MLLIFIARRLVQAVVVIFVVTVVVFVMTRLVADPVRLMLPIAASDAERASLAHSLGLDQPIALQFLNYIRDALRLNFGLSIWQQRPAMSIVAEHLPFTLELVLVGMLLALAVAIPLGTAAALRPKRVLDHAVTVLCLLGASIPQFWLGLLLIVLFAVQLRWLPTSGSGGVVHLILPALTLAIPPAGRVALMVRSAVAQELRQPYVIGLKAKGITFRRIIGVHVARNAAMPVLTVAVWELIRSIAGNSVLVETVFAWPGLGLLAFQSIQRQDLILLQSVVLTVAVLIVAVNFAADLLYKLVDPRIAFA